MIKRKKLPRNIEELIPRAIDCLQSHSGMCFAYLFGSLGKGKLLPLSDVDIAIYLKDTEFVAEKKLQVLGDLIDILQTDEIDLVVLNNAPLTLRIKILQNSRLIVDNNPFIRHAYESKTMREYFDFSKIEASILNRRFFNG